MDGIGEMTMRIQLLGTPVDILSAEETLTKIDSAILSRNRLQHVALNVAKLVSLRTNEELRSDVGNSDLVGIDGMGIVLALRFLGYKSVARVSGVDLMNDTLALCARRGFKPYFLGATAAVLDSAIKIAQQKNPGLKIAGSHHGYFKSEEENQILSDINTSQADCLFIAMPTPRKERLLAKWRTSLNVPFIMGVGGSFDVLAGKVQRAPDWMQRNGLEWAYRVYQEPSRMWWRYLSTNTVFLGLLLKIAFARMVGGNGNQPTV